VQAVYGVYSKGIRKLDLQGGLRAEYASRDFVLTDASYPHDYTSLFPSAAATYNWSDAWQYKASYSRRIRRPGTQELNPFPHFFDAQNVFYGNPELDAEYTDSYELGLTRTGKLGSLQLSPYYRTTADKIDINIDTDDVFEGREVTSVSFRNMASSESWGADLNGNLRFGQKLNAFGGLNVFRMETDGGSTSSLSASGTSWMARMNLTSQVTKATTLQGSYFYRAAMPVPGGEFAPMQMANFSVRQKIAGDASSVTLRVVDPFDTQRMRVRAGNDNTTQRTSRHFGVRAVFLSYQYTFGRPPRIRNRPEDQPQGPPSGFPG
jgi:outer membrane receptor protein involved in Fe transport